MTRTRRHWSDSIATLLVVVACILGALYVLTWIVLPPLAASWFVRELFL